METPLEGTPLIVHAIDLVIADLQAGDHDDSEEQLRMLHSLRAQLIAEPDSDS